MLPATPPVTRYTITENSTACVAVTVTGNLHCIVFPLPLQEILLHHAPVTVTADASVSVTVTVTVTGPSLKYLASVRVTIQLPLPASK